jgi:hypothetical protein
LPIEQIEILAVVSVAVAIIFIAYAWRTVYRRGLKK